MWQHRPRIVLGRLDSKSIMLREVSLLSDSELFDRIRVSLPSIFSILLFSVQTFANRQSDLVGMLRKALLACTEKACWHVQKKLPPIIRKSVLAGP
jgi:hypothetical protein